LAFINSSATASVIGKTVLEPSMLTELVDPPPHPTNRKARASTQAMLAREPAASGAPEEKSRREAVMVGGRSMEKSDIGQILS
jgi:hypothetical protein